MSIIRYLKLQGAERFLRGRRILRCRKILNSVTIEDSIRRLRNVVVLLDGGLVGHQVVLVSPRKPIVDRDSLDVTDVLPEPFLHEAVETLVHSFRHLWMCLKHNQSKRYVASEQTAVNVLPVSLFAVSCFDKGCNL